MRLLVSILILSFVNVSAGDDSDSQPRRMLSEDFIAEIRNTNPTWTAYEPNENPLNKYTDAQLKRLFAMPGIDMKEFRKTIKERKERMTQLKTTALGNDKLLRSEVNNLARAAALPTNFSWVEESPYKACAYPVEDQGSCGSCYAFATATVFSIRRCMALAKANGGTITQVPYSAQDLLSCNVHTKQCDGGIIDLSFKYLEDFGITTRSCQPYLDIATETPNGKSCRPSSCSSSEKFTKQYCKKGTSIFIYGTERIKYEIYNSGPVATYMETYQDLGAYSGGIYKHDKGVHLGGHAVVIVGWGRSDRRSGSIDYWIVRNSWGSWGNDGYFFIDMTDEASGLGEVGVYCIPEI